MSKSRWLFVAVIGLVLLLTQSYASVQTKDSSVGGGGGGGRIQLLIDGKDAGSFQEVSGLGMEISAFERRLPVSCPEGACISTLKRGVDSLASIVEESEKMFGKTKHDIAMNSIRNIRARIAGVGGSMGHLTDPKQATAALEGLLRIQLEAATLKALFCCDDDSDGDGWEDVRKRAQDQIKAIANESARLEQMAVTGEEPLGGSVARKMPGRTSYQAITLTRQLHSDSSTAQWAYIGLEAAKRGEPVPRKSISIIFLDRDGKETARYNLFECFPTKYSVVMTTDQSGMVIEKIEIAVEKVERA